MWKGFEETMTKRVHRTFTHIDRAPSKLKSAKPIRHSRGDFITVHHRNTDRDELLRRLQVHHQDKVKVA
jgi:hypothetical protein